MVAFPFIKFRIARTSHPLTFVTRFQSSIFIVVRLCRVDAVHLHNATPNYKQASKGVVFIKSSDFKHNHRLLISKMSLFGIDLNCIPVNIERNSLYNSYPLYYNLIIKLFVFFCPFFFFFFNIKFCV